MELIGHLWASYSSTAGDLFMAVLAAVLCWWVYRFGPSDNRVMLRYWVLGLAFLCFAGLLGAIIEAMRADMAGSERMSARLGLAAMYMAAGLFQLFAILELFPQRTLGKDLLMGFSGAAYLVTLVIALIYQQPDAKMYFLLFSSGAALIALFVIGQGKYLRHKWLISGASLQLLGVVSYFTQLHLGSISPSLLFNILMLAGLLFYLKGLRELARTEKTEESRPTFQPLEPVS